LLLIIPLVPFAISFALALVAWIWSRTVSLRHVHSFHLGFMCQTNKHVKMYLYRCLKASIPFLGVVYNNVCLMTFNAFSCQQLRDGRWAMNAQPSIICWESEGHRAMVGVSIVAIIVYVFGLPFFTLSSTMYAYRHDLLKDEQWLATIGLFYREYGANHRIDLGAPGCVECRQAVDLTPLRIGGLRRASVLLVGLRVPHAATDAVPVRRGVPKQRFRARGAPPE
jgi:hypothetical protein